VGRRRLAPLRPSGRSRLRAAGRSRTERRRPPEPAVRRPIAGDRSALGTCQTLTVGSRVLKDLRRLATANWDARPASDARLTIRAWLAARHRRAAALCQLKSTR
jgi:hypothetical protein